MSGILDIKLWFDHVFKFSDVSEYAYSVKVLHHLLISSWCFMYM